MIDRVRLDKIPKAPTSTPARIKRLALFGPPPLIEGEDAAAYDELSTEISAAVNPADIFEDIWVRDITVLYWEVLRLRRLKVNLMTATAYNGLGTVLQPLLDEGLSELVANWARRIPRAVKRVDGLLASVGLTKDAIMAHTLTENLDHLERIDRMIAMAEGRRDAMLREIERHRATLANTLRRTVEQIEEGEYQVVDQKSTGGSGAA
jgi:hypothetical protein